MKQALKRERRTSTGHSIHEGTIIPVGSTDWDSASPMFTNDLGDEPVDQYFADALSRSSWVFNDCTNVKYWGNLNYSDGISTITSLPMADGPYYAVDVPIASLIENASFRGSLLPVNMGTSTDPSSLLKWGEDVFASSALPSELIIDKDPFDSGFSLWYLIVDLVQLQGLFTSLFSSKALNRRFRRIDELDNFATAKALADDHLMVQFGILPTIADLQKFVSLLSEWRDRYDEAQEKIRTERSWHSAPIDVPDVMPPLDTVFNGVTSTGTFALPSQLFISGKVAVSTSRFYRTARYRFESPEFLGWMGRVRQFIDAFGVLDPAALWDVIPFSFIVDWFFGIGNWLHANRPQLFPADLVVTDYCESIKLVQRINYTLTYPRWNGQLADDAVVSTSTHYIGFEERVVYLRRRFLPPSVRTTAPIKLGSMVNFRRALISASLIAQRLPRG